MNWKNLGFGLIMALVAVVIASSFASAQNGAAQNGARCDEWSPNWTRVQVTKVVLAANQVEEPGATTIVSTTYALEQSANGVWSFASRVPTRGNGGSQAANQGGGGSSIGSLPGNGSWAVPAGGTPDQTMSTHWKSGGFDVGVDTVRKEGESAKAQAKRHKEAVDALVGFFPPNSPGVSDCSQYFPPPTNSTTVQVVWQSGGGQFESLCNAVITAQTPFCHDGYEATVEAQGVAAMQVYFP